MKKLLLITLIFFSGLCLKAQTNLDSLYTVWQDETQTDSSRTEAYKTYISKGFLYSNPDTAFIFAQNLLRFGNVQQYARAKAKAYHLMGASKWVIFDYPKALDYFFKCLKVKEEIGDKIGSANSIMNIGNIYEKQGDYPKALDYYSQSLKIYEEIGNKKSCASTIYNIGSIYKSQGNYPKALDYYSQSLKIEDGIGNKIGQANCIMGIGLIYQNQKDYSKAFEYYFQSLKIREEIGDKGGSASCIHNIGIIYQNQEDYPKALDYYSQSLEIKKEIGDKRGSAATINNIGLVYKDQGDYTKALEYYQRSLKIKEEIGDKRGSAATIGNIGMIYADQGDYPKALEYCKKSQLVSQEIEALVIEKNACKCLYEIYKILGKGNEALVYIEKLNIIEDSLYAEETAKTLLQMEFNKQVLADSLAREKIIFLAQQKEEEIIQSKNRKNQIQYSLMFMVVLFLAALIAAMTKFSYNPKVAAALIFIFFILIFEFLLVVLDPWVETITNGEVGFKILLNSLMALFIFGIHQISEKRLKKVLIK